MKRVLVTAGVVYGPLDDNKLVGNRVRGIWAWQFAHWLVAQGHEVTLLVADIQEEQMRRVPFGAIRKMDEPWGLHIETHKGFWDYQERCRKLTCEHDAAVMAAAVVNWIPEKPFPGKMPTDAPSGTIMSIPFVLAPRVIDEMRRENPKLTLIGCKMTIGATEDGLVEAAYKTLLGAHCHAVIANDMKLGLRRKLVVHPDRTVVSFTLTHSPTNEAPQFYEHLLHLILDEHYQTRMSRGWAPDVEQARRLFDRIVERYRTRFIHRSGADERVFGAVAVRVEGGALCSPREKDGTFYSTDAVLAELLTEDDYKAHTVRARPLVSLSANWKPSLNAPLLLRHLGQYPRAAAVLHLHEQLPNVSTVPYAPPSTVRDNERGIPGPVYNIEGHGFVAALDADGEVWKL
jgi:hypothetical protein